MHEGDGQQTEVHPSAGDPATAVLRVRGPRGPTPPDVRDISFRTAVRGYERRAVDRYVERANHVIAELEITRSPESAVRHALERVGEQTSGILQRARETADEITHTARAEADEILERASAEARDILAAARTKADAVIEDAEEAARERAAEAERELELARGQAADARAQAEREVQELRTHGEAIADERKRVVEEARGLAARLEAVADSAGAARVLRVTPSAAREGDGHEPTGIEAWQEQLSDN